MHLKYSMNKIKIALLLTLGLSSFNSLAGPPGSGWQLKYQDSFDGNRLKSNWIFREDSHFQRNNVEVSNGTLKIKNTMDGAHNTGAWIESGPSFGRTGSRGQYGYFEARVRIRGGAANGKIWPTWWVWGGNINENNRRNTTEFDIFEYNGFALYDEPTSSHHYRNRRSVGINDSRNFTSTNEYEAPLGRDENGWHNWGLLWSPKQVSFYYDGRKVYTSNLPLDAKNERRPLRLIFSSSPHVRDGVNGASDPEQPDNPRPAANLPRPNERLPIFEVDWVRVWQTGLAERQRFVNLIKDNGNRFAIDGGFNGIEGTEVKLFRRNNQNNNQDWVEIDRGNGFVSYRKRFTNQCIDGGPVGSGPEVKLFYCGTNNRNQHWKKVSAGNGRFRLLKRNQQQFSLDGRGVNRNDLPIQLGASNRANRNQHWLINQRVGIGG